MADLKVTITEDISLNNKARGSTNTLTVTGINHTMDRIVTCPASQTTTIATFNSNVYGAANAVDLEDTRYIRITNLDSSNAVELAVVGAATIYQVSLAAGHSHILGPPDDCMLAEADTSPSFGTMADLASIQVNPGSNAVKVELFIAGT